MADNTTLEFNINCNILNPHIPQNNDINTYNENFTLTNESKAHITTEENSDDINILDIIIFTLSFTIVS